MRKILKRSLKRAAVYVTIICFKIAAAQTYVFTTAGANGSNGPSQLQIDAAYLTTNLNGLVSSVNGIQTWTVPVNGLYRIETLGAQGGSEVPLKFGGKGSLMSGEFNLAAGTVLKILVGQQGSSFIGCYGGGGGSFVSTLANAPLIISGGGGGAGGLMGGNGVDASIGLNGTAGVAGGQGGANGYGGFSNNTNGGSGGGFFSDGNGDFYIPECSTTVGKAFINGGIGGQFDDWKPGGFGGGGSAWSGNGNGGGGGGYSGGGTSGSSFLGGGGGGSYNSGSNQNNQQGVGSGDGSVTIICLKRYPIDIAPDGEITGGGTVGTTTVGTITNDPELILNEKEMYTVKPNPSNGFFRITIEESDPTYLKVFSSLGKLVFEKRTEFEMEYIDLTELPNGIYYLSVGNHKIKKLIVDRN